MTAIDPKLTVRNAHAVIKEFYEEDISIAQVQRWAEQRKLPFGLDPMTKKLVIKKSDLIDRVKRIQYTKV